MTRDEKLSAHLEAIIFEDLPEGTRLNAQEMNRLTAAATADQKRRAYARALIRSPLLLDNERHMLPEGTRVRLVAMLEDPDPLPVGTTGTVLWCTDLTDYVQIEVKWDIPRSLSLCVPPDRYERIDPTTREDQQ